MTEDTTLKYIFTKKTHNLLWFGDVLQHNATHICGENDRLLITTIQ